MLERHKNNEYLKHYFKGITVCSFINNYEFDNKYVNEYIDNFVDYIS